MYTKYSVGMYTSKLGRPSEKAKTKAAISKHAAELYRHINFGPATNKDFQRFSKGFLGFCSFLWTVPSECRTEHYSKRYTHYHLVLCLLRTGYLVLAINLSLHIRFRTKQALRSHNHSPCRVKKVPEMTSRLTEY